MYSRSKAAPMDWERQHELPASPLWTPRSPFQTQPLASSTPPVADTSIPDVEMEDQSTVLEAEQAAAERAAAAAAASNHPGPDTSSTVRQGHDEADERKPRVFEKGHLFQKPRTRDAVERVRGLRHRRSHRALVPAGHANEADDQDADEDKSADLSLSRAAGTAINYFFSPPTPPPAPNNQALTHLDWPEVFLGYAQFFFNAIVLAGVLYIAYSIIATIALDVHEKVESTISEAIQDTQDCKRNYIESKCGTQYEILAIREWCRDWERCMARNPSVVGRSTVAAGFLAETLNEFIDKLSWKTTLFLLALVGLGVRAANTIFSYFRFQSAQRRSERVKESKYRSHHAPNQQGYYPLTPGRHAGPSDRTLRATARSPWHALPDESADLSTDVTTT